MNKKRLYEIVNKKGQRKEPMFTRYWDKNFRKHDIDIVRVPFVVSNIVGPNVLDAGCGTGLFCHLASELDNVKEIHGVDLQHAVLEDAKANVKSDKVTFHHGYAEDLKFADEYFNTVLLTETLEHVASIEEALSEACRVLKITGRIVITCPHNGNKSELHINSISEKYLKTAVEKHFKIKKFNPMLLGASSKKKLFCVGVK